MELVNWDGQTNLNCPYQFNLRYIRYAGIKNSLINFIKYLYYSNLSNYFQKISFDDDLKIISKINGMKILEENPIHKFFKNENCFFLNDKVSTNNRWNRYIYLASQIKRKNF